MLGYGGAARGRRRGVRGTGGWKGVEVAKEGISEEGGVLVGVEGD